MAVVRRGKRPANNDNGDFSGSEEHDNGGITSRVIVRKENRKTFT